MDTKTDSKMDASSSAPYYEHLLPDCQKLFGTAHPKSIEHHVFTSELLMNKRLLDTDILEPRIRIPAYIEPLHYDLAIQPDFENLTFKGLVKIHYDTRGEDYKFKYFYLHMVDLVIEKGYVEDESNEITNIRRAFYDRQNEVCLLETLSLMPGKGTLSLLFRGNLNDKLKGFYRTSYKVGDKEYLAGSTQFEATDARRCFPCVDEPNAKATFSLTILFKNDVIDLGDRKIERIAISNTPIAEIDNNPKFKEKGLSVVVFQKTPRMSTYLLAFAVGHFDHIEAHDGLRPIRVYTTPGKSEQGKFALDVACKSLRYFEKYFGIEYPLPKMDLIAVPDFASGAMENWGLVTYRETCILVDSESSTTARKQWVALVVAHELAHQWFGNLVTMEWWTDLWLKEGFATFMEYLCVDEIFPEYDIWSQFVYDCHSRALELDSLQSSHPIQVDVMLASEVDEIFDDISYNKGASLIRMMYNYIGDEHFRNGMKAYLNEHAYKNASTSDLWRALGAASEKPISALMSKWTMEAGYPFISVKLSPDQDSVLKLEQLTFSSEALFYTRKSKWMIPIYLTTEQDPKNVISKGLLPEPSMDITVDGVKEKWVKMNPGAIGLYRTYYPDEILQRLTRAIRDKTLPPVDRFNIVNDYFALCKAGHVDSSRLLNLLKAYDCEDEYIVWCSIDECISHISTLLAYTDFQSLFYTYGIKLYSKILERLTWSPLDGEKHTDKMTRALVINRMVAFGEPSVVAEAQRKYNAHVSGEEVMPADLRGAVYIAVAKSGDDASFDSLYDLHKEVQLQEEKNRIARALGFAKVGPRLDRVVEFVMSDQVRNQDKDAVVASISINCPLVAWKLFTDHHEWFREKYESGSLMSRLVKCATHNFASIEQATTIQKFFENHNLPGTSKAVMQSVEQIHRNARWLSSEADAIKTFLQTD